MIDEELAYELKIAGFPQPEMLIGQIWYDGSLPFIIQDYFWHIFSTKTFAPTLDDIAPLLPEGFAIEMWGGKPSCTNRDEANPVLTFGDTFTEAAARMWLHYAQK